MENKKYIFDNINKKEIFLLTIYSVMVFILCLFNQFKLVSILSIFAIIISFLSNPTLSLGIYIISSNYISYSFNNVTQILVLLIVLLGLYLKNCNKFYKDEILLLLLSIISIVCSCNFGYDVTYSNAVFMILAIVTFILIYKHYNKKSVSSIIYAFFVSSLIISLLSVINYYINGASTLLYGRLNFNGDIKGLAILDAFPFSFIILSRMDGKKIFNLKINNLITILVTFVLGMTIILTSARGVILAVVVGIITKLLISKSKTKSTKYIIIGFIILLIVYYIFSEINIFRIERIFKFEEYSDGNGRTEIWAKYIELIISKGFISILFGYGPGNIARISNTSLYAHSTFLDYFFSYGLFGLLLITIFEIISIKRVIKLDKQLLFPLLLIIIIMNISHGSSANITMFIMQALLLCSESKDGEENVS